MSHSRAYYVVLVGIAIMSICEPYSTTVFLPQPVDAAINVAWLFVQGAAAFCVGADVYRWMKGRA